MSGLIAAIATGTVALAGSVSSFAQASKQKKKQAMAEQEARKAMTEAKKRLEVNVMERLSIQKEPYEQQIMAMLTQGQAGLQAGVEGDERGAAATAGRTYMGQLAGQERVRTAMGQELQDIELAKIKEEARLADLGMGLNLEESAGAQEAAANAEMLRAQAIQQGFEGLVQAGSAVAGAAPLYGGGGGAPKVDTVGGPKVDYSMSKATEARLGQPTLQQSQFSPPSQFDLYQGGVQQTMPNPYDQYQGLFSSFGGTLPMP
jgi:hypothetical protein